jgi:hypothetical protein
MLPTLDNNTNDEQYDSSDVLEQRPFTHYVTNNPYHHDPEWWHTQGIRIGEA